MIIINVSNCLYHRLISCICTIINITLYPTYTNWFHFISTLHHKFNSVLQKKRICFIRWLILAVLNFYEKHFDSWRCPWIVLAHKLCIKYTDKHKLPLDAQRLILYIYQIRLIILFDSLIYLVVSRHTSCIISIGHKWKWKVPVTHIFLLFLCFLHQLSIK